MKRINRLNLVWVLLCGLLIAACGGEADAPATPTAVPTLAATVAPTVAATPTAEATAEPVEEVVAAESLTETATVPTEAITVEEETVTIENVSFQSAPLLPGVWSGGLVEANSDPDAPPDLTLGPRRVVITGAVEMDGQSPTPYLIVYKVADLAGTPEQAEADALADLLAANPEPADLAAMPVLPFLPQVNAVQAVHGAEQPLNFGDGAGIRYVGAFAQDPSPFLAQSFHYTFQGLSTDGIHYVALFVPLSTELFPAELPADFDADAHVAGYDEYLVETKATLSGAAPGAFTPDLANLDAFVQSITVTDAGGDGVDFSGLYTASLPGPDPGRPVTLTLNADGAAILTTDQLNGDGSVTEVGSWQTTPDRLAVVTFTGTEDEPYDEPNVITFTLSADQLVAVGFSHPENYGTVGLQLQRVPPAGAAADPPAELTAHSWQLVKISGADGSELTPDDPTRYTLTFGDDWRVSVQADCNQGGGPYNADDGTLVIGQLITTLAACPDDSLYEPFMQGLGQVAGYAVTDGALTLTLNDGGALEFESSGH